MSQHAVKLRARLIHPHIVCFHTDFLPLSSESEYKKLIMDSRCYSTCHNDRCKQIIQAWCKPSNSISWFHYSCMRCTVVSFFGEQSTETTQSDLMRDWQALLYHTTEYGPEYVNSQWKRWQNRTPVAWGTRESKKESVMKTIIKQDYRSTTKVE